MDAALAQAFELTWPAAEYADAGGFRVGRSLGAGGRVNSARVAGDWKPTDIDAAEALQKSWRQPPLFRALDSDTALQKALEDRGFHAINPTSIMEATADSLTDLAIPRIMTFAIWPPLAIQRDIWGVGNIDAARQAVMERVITPKTSILGRIEDRAAGSAFVAIYQNVAMVHAVEILSDWRRKGLAGWMMRQAAFLAVENGATRLGLAVSRENKAAAGLYESLGFREVAGYRYYAKEI